MVPQTNIVNAERRGKRQVLIRPSSKVIVKFLSVMQRHGTSSPSPFPSAIYSLFFFSRFTDISYFQVTLANLR
jgi:hypothetical protein